MASKMSYSSLLAFIKKKKKKKKKKISFLATKSF